MDNGGSSVSLCYVYPHIIIVSSHSRIRRVRCDGARPQCSNCRRRDDPLAPCVYDAAPRRRGQDRVPGGRKLIANPTKKSRTTRSRVEEAERRKIRATDTAANEPGDTLNDRLRPSGSNLEHQRHHLEHSESYDAPLEEELLSELQLVIEDDPLCLHVAYPSGTILAFRPSEDEDDNRHGSPPVAAQPSAQFTRETWWNALIAFYAFADCEVPGSFELTPATRDGATKRIAADLRLMFRTSLSWYSFLNVPRFFCALLDPLRRTTVQPSLILGALANATLFQSSELEGGAKGRARALKLFEGAHAAFHASLASGWVDIGLVQAAWVSRASILGTEGHLTANARCLRRLRCSHTHSVAKRAQMRPSASSMRSSGALR